MEQIAFVNDFTIRKLHNGYTLQYRIGYENGDSLKEIFVPNHLVEEFRKAMNIVDDVCK
jgi:hypothetical protein